MTPKFDCSYAFVWTFFAALFLYLSTIPQVAALDNGLARLPPMGWMSAERFGCNVNCQDYPDGCISESLVKSIADSMQYKFRQAGYTYLAVDDCWMARNRTADGKLQADPKRFPGGIESLAKYVQSKGLKLGLYLAAGNQTCNGYPGSQDHYPTDAQTLASWGVDMLKFSACGVSRLEDLHTIFPEMGQHLNKTGQPIMYLCEWPSALQDKGIQIDYKLVSHTCNQYRTYKDVTDSWESLHDLVEHFGDNGRPYFNYSKPGSWMDPDQLVVGDFGLSENQQRMQLAVWAVMGAPLFVSADMRHLGTVAGTLLLNEKVIRINQDPLGVMGVQITVIGQVRIWRKPLSKPLGSFALALLYMNVSGGPSKVTVKLQDLGLTTSGAYNLTNVFDETFMGIYKPWYYLNCEVNPTGVLLIEALALD